MLLDNTFTTNALFCFSKIFKHVEMICFPPVMAESIKKQLSLLNQEKINQNISTNQKCVVLV